MLKIVVVFVGVLAVFAASSDAEARGFRRSRGNCPNGQCYASIPNAVAAESDADSTVAEVPGPPAVDAPALPVVETPVSPELTASVSNRATVGRTNFRFARGARFFRRR